MQKHLHATALGATQGAEQHVGLPNLVTALGFELFWAVGASSSLLSDIAEHEGSGALPHFSRTESTKLSSDGLPLRSAFSPLLSDL